MAFHLHNPEQYQTPGLIIFSAYLWLRNDAEIDPGRGSNRVLTPTIYIHTAGDEHYVNLMIALRDYWKNTNPYFIVPT